MDFTDILQFIEGRTTAELWLFTCDELMEALDEHAKDTAELEQLHRVVVDCKELLGETLAYRRKLAMEKLNLESRSSALLSKRYLSDLHRVEQYLKNEDPDL